MLGDHDVGAGGDGLGLSLAESVEEMDLAVGRYELAGRVEGDRGVVNPVARRWLEDTGGQRDAAAAGRG